MKTSVGLSLRHQWLTEFEHCPSSAVDVLEIMVDDFIDAPPSTMAKLRQLRRRWPLIGHGVGLNIASVEGIDRHYLSQIRRTCERLGIHWYSEHLAMTAAGNTKLGHFVAVDDDPNTLAVLRENSRHVQSSIARPFLLENPSDVLGLQATNVRSQENRGRRLGEAYMRSLRASEAGALLDLTNLVIDAHNDSWCPLDFISALDGERIIEVHLAGGQQNGPLWLDSHDDVVDEVSLELLRHVRGVAPNLQAVIIERDENLPALDLMLDEVEQVRQIMGRA